MTASGWIQIGLFALVVFALTKPLGLYMHRVFEGGRQPFPRVLGRLERALYRGCGVDPRKEQTWKGYAAAIQRKLRTASVAPGVQRGGPGETWTSCSSWPQPPSSPSASRTCAGAIACE